MFNNQQAQNLRGAIWRIVVLSLPLFFLPFTRYNFEPDKAALFRALVLVLLLLYLLTLRRPNTRPRGISLDRLSLLVLFFWWWVTLATLFSIEPTRSLWGEPRWGQGWITLTCYVALFGLARVSLSGDRDQQGLIDAVLFASVPVSVYGLAQKVGLDPLHIVAPWERIQSTFPHANALGGYLVLVMPFCWFRVVRGPNHRLWIVCALLQALCLLFTSSRSAWVAAAAAGWLFVYMLAKSRHRRIILASMAAAGAILLVTLSLLPPAHPTAPTLWRSITSLVRLSSPTVQIRLNIWQGIVDAVAQRPLFGYGPETLDLALPGHPPPELSLYGNIKTVAGRGHNDLLEWALFAGIPAAVAYGGLLTTVFVQGWRRIKQGNHALALPVWIALMGGIINQLIDVGTITSNLLIWLFAALLTTRSPDTQEDSLSFEFEWMPVRVGLVILTLVGITVVSIRPVIADTYGREALALYTLRGWDESDAAVIKAEMWDPRRFTYAALQADITLGREDSKLRPDDVALLIAASRLELALQQTPTDLELWRRLVEVRRVLAYELNPTYWPDAFATCKQMLIVAPEDPDLFMLCGDLRLWAREPSGALPYYLAASELAPLYDQPYYNLSTVYRWLGDDDLAEAYSVKAKDARAEWEQMLGQR